MDDNVKHDARRASSRRLRVVALLALLTAGGAALRAWRADVAYVYSDECFTWRICRTPFVEMLQRAGADTHPPAHFLLLRCWIAACGDSPLALRAPSILAGSLCVPLAFVVVREACRPLPSATTAAIFSAALTALNAVQITHGRIARAYPLAALLSLVATWLLLRALRPARSALEAAGAPRPGEATWTWWWAYGVTAALFCLAHHFASFTLAAHALFVAGLALRLGKRGSFAELRQLFMGGVMAGGMALALYSPWLPVLAGQVQRTHTWFWVPKLTSNETLAALVQWNVGVAPTDTWTAWTAVTGVLACLLIAARRVPAAVWLTALMFLVPWTLTVFVSTVGGRPLLQERYLLFANSALLLLLGTGYASLRHSVPRALFAAATAALFVPATCWYVGTFPADAPAMEKAMAWLASRYQPGDVVTVSLPQTVNIAKYYAARAGFDVDARVYLLPVPDGGQTIHTTSIAGDDLLHDGPHAPPPSAGRWWTLDTQDGPTHARAGWKRTERETFVGPRATREVAGSEHVVLELYGRLD